MIVYVTVCTKHRKPILADRKVHECLRDAWRLRTAWLMGKYIIMPDHIHFFCAPGEFQPIPVAQWVKFWKSHSARFWPYRDQAPVWQRECWDTQLRRHESYTEKWCYIQMNPVRAGLAESPNDWPYQGELNELRW